MTRIVARIPSLQQHIETLSSTPEIYRLHACPNCGVNRLWRHGCYFRKADLNPPTCGELNPVPIARFYCGECHRTCSRLPSCIAPRRWYGWAVQQAVLLKLLAGCSLNAVSLASQPCRHTVRRWWRWLSERNENFGFHLRSRFPELGRAPDWKAFWKDCLDRMPLSEAMAWLDRDGVLVP